MSFVIDADSKLDYGCDWAAWLGTDTILLSTWTITPTGPVLTNSTWDNTTTTIWVDGCTNSAEYELTNHVTTTAGREHDRTIYLRCRPR